MHIGTDIDGSTLTVFLEGELDHHSAAEARERMDTLVSANGINELVLDMSAVTFMDSSGLGVVLGRYKYMKGRGGRMYIAGTSRCVDRIFKMAGVYALVGHREVHGGIS